MPEKDFLEQGLASREVQERLVKFGRNELMRAQEFSVFKLFLSQFKSPLIYILVLAGLVTLFLRDFTDSVVIFVAVFLNTVLGFYQEQKAQKAMVALRQYLSSKAKVIRDGKQQLIDVAELVPGDLVILTIGTRIPADGILVEATDFSVNEAILTGESMPVSKSQIPNPKSQTNINFLNSKFKKENQVFMGTMVATGIAKMLVTQTGMSTKMGKIGRDLGTVEEEDTPLQLEINRLAKIMALIFGGVTLLIFLLGWTFGYPILEMFTLSVAVAVAAIPEGLMVTLTVILSLGMQRILKRKALVRKLLSAETLGSVSVICADKTGTLTEGKMRVVEAVTDLGAKSEVRSQKGDLLVKAAVLCNDLRDPLEIAMLDWALRFAQGKPLTIEKLKEQFPRLDEIPFSPDYKYIATLHSQRTKNKEQRTKVLFLSGAPEVILSKCKIGSQKYEEWIKKFEELGSRGYRLVGFAYKELRTKNQKLKTEDLKGLSWLGILVYEDPVREGVKTALEECQRAGIKIKVITGDYVSTAVSVLKKLGLWSDRKTQVIEGAELEKISEKQLAKIVDGIVLFARTSPGQKLKIVQALKDRGEVVAMMGDGVNDAPALKNADIGVVVEGASDVARETADLVLLDTNFSTIVEAIKEGRMIFENIKKVVFYLLSNSFSEAILIGGSLLLGLSLPVTAAQILWVNLVEDVFPAMAFAFEPRERGVMNQPPRAKTGGILNRQLKILIALIALFTTLSLFLVLWVLEIFGLNSHRQTTVFVALAGSTLVMALACRSFKVSSFRLSFFSNQYLLGSIFLGFLLLLAAVYLPPLQALLKTQALGIFEWILVLVIILINFLAVELGKKIFLQRKKAILYIAGQKP